MELNSQLYFAVDNNDIDKLSSLIENGINVNEVYEDDMNISTQSILHICCIKGRVECARLLVQAGASLYARDNWGLTPLMHSCSTLCLDVVKLLLEIDPDIVNIQDNYGKAALHTAVEGNSEECVQILIDYGADVDVQNDEGLTPITICCSLEVDEGDPNVILKMLIDSGASVNLKDFRCRRTPLQNACLTKKIAAVEILLEAGADTDTLDSAGRTPLTNLICEHVRGFHNSRFIDPDVFTIIVMLIQAGTDINLNMCEYSNPLIAAVSVKAHPLVHFLLNSGADPNVKFVTGISPLLLAVTRNDLAVVKTLLYWNCNLYSKGRIYKRRQLIEHMLDPFELCLLQKQFDIADLMLSVGYKKANISTMFKRKDLPVSLTSEDDILQWVQENTLFPESLLNLSIFAVRHSLQQRVIVDTEKLPLPSRVKEMVLMKNLLYDEQEA